MFINMSPVITVCRFFYTYIWRLLRVPWTARRSNQSILKEISPGCSLEGMILKLKLQYFGHLMPRVDSLEKTLMLGGIGGRRRRGWQDEMAGWHHWLMDIMTHDIMDVSLSELRKLVMDREAKSQTWLRDWTELNWWRDQTFWKYNINFFSYSNYLDPLNNIDWDFLG